MDSPFTKQINPFSKQVSPYTKQANPFSKYELTNLLLENYSYLLLETGEKIHV